jgi:sugar phosphate isomerase/epimerase
VDELLEWPWLRLERFYAAFVFREALDRLERQKDLIISALHANSVYDEHKEARRDEAVRNVEEQFADMARYLKRQAKGMPEAEPDDGYDEDNPFWAAAKRGAEKMTAPRADEADDGVTAGELVEAELSAKEMKEMLESLDQS